MNVVEFVFGIYRDARPPEVRLPILFRKIKSSTPQSVANRTADTKSSYRNLLENVEYIDEMQE